MALQQRLERAGAQPLGRVRLSKLARREEREFYLFISLWIIRSEEHTSELQSRSVLHSFPTRRSSDLSFKSTVYNVFAYYSRATIRSTLPQIRRSKWHCSRGWSGRALSRWAGSGSASWRAAKSVNFICLSHSGSSDRKSTRLNSSHVAFCILSLHDALPIFLLNRPCIMYLPITVEPRFAALFHR